MDMNEFMEQMLTTYPKAQVEQDNEGQLVIYTGLTMRGDQVVEMPEGEEEYAE